MADTFKMINIIRAYELSWLNPKGKPMLGILELEQDGYQKLIDTWSLKNYLESINNTVFTDINIIKNNFENARVKIVMQNDFATFEFFENSKQINSKYKLLSSGLRFICQETGQPYIGTLNLCVDKDSDIKPKLIADLLLILRNQEFTPNNFVAELYLRLKNNLHENFVLSVHLNRRGGISYQAIRSSQDLDFSVFKLRSILE